MILFGGLSGRAIDAWDRASALGLVVMFVGTIGLATLSSVVFRPHSTKAAAGDMILFWDGTDSTGGALSVPSGWTEISSAASGRMIRGEAAANFGGTGGSTTHSHHNESVTMTGVNGSVGTGLTLSGISADNHSHGTLSSVNTISSANNEPATRTIRAIQYNSGIPATIPNGAIVMFDDSPGMPGSGFTRLSAYDGKVLKLHTTAGTNAGSDTHTHTVTWTGTTTGAPTSTNICSGFIFCSSGATAKNTASHNHAAPGSTTSSSGSNVPPYVQPVLAKANADVATASVAVTVMFEGSPGDLWTSRSESGGAYYRRFLRPGASYIGSGGADNHTHTAVGITGSATGGGNVNTGTGSGGASSTHTHSLTASFYDGSSDSYYTGNNEYFLPEYVNVVIAERVTMSLNSYRWYEDNNLQAVTDPWSPLDVPINNMIPALPANYRPPVSGNELRLRVKILLGNQPLYASSIAFKLQYKAGTDGSCTSGTWTDVGAGGGGSIWRFATSGVSHDTSLSTSVLTSSVRQTYSKANPTGLNPNAGAVGQTMEYDFHIENNGANSARQYSFRLVESDDGVMSDYAQCPTLVTSPVTSDQMRHGEFFQDGVERGFFWAN